MLIWFAMEGVLYLHTMQPSSCDWRWPLSALSVIYCPLTSIKGSAWYTNISRWWILKNTSSFQKTGNVGWHTRVGGGAADLRLPITSAGSVEYNPNEESRSRTSFYAFHLQPKDISARRLVQQSYTSSTFTRTCMVIWISCEFVNALWSLFQPKYVRCERNTVGINTRRTRGADSAIPGFAGLHSQGRVRLVSSYTHVEVPM